MRWLHLKNRVWNVYVAARYAWRYGVEDDHGWPVFPHPVCVHGVRRVPAYWCADCEGMEPF